MARCQVAQGAIKQFSVQAPLQEKLRKSDHERQLLVATLVQAKKIARCYKLTKFNPRLLAMERLRSGLARPALPGTARPSSSGGLPDSGVAGLPLPVRCRAFGSGKLSQYSSLDQIHGHS